MGGTNLKKVLVQRPLNFEKEQKPLLRMKEYIVALTESASLLHRLLIEVKELVLLLGMIIFSVWAVVALLHLHH